MSPGMPPLLAQVAVTLVVVALALVGYDRMVKPQPLRVGIVDLNSVYREKEAEFTRRVTRAVTDADREQAMVDAREFARRLPTALESLPQECQCLVALSTAIVAPTPETLDLTPLLRNKLGAP